MKKLCTLFAFISLLFPAVTFAASCPNITVRLSNGTSHSQVIALKKFLVAEGVMVPTANTTFFGPLTQAALQKWQCTKGIVCSGTPASTGYGATGPLTRAALKNCNYVSNVPVVPSPSGTRPISTTPINPGNGGGATIAPPITYSWNSSAWSSCVDSTQSRSVSCISSANANVPETFCTASKPPVTQSCTVASTPPHCTPFASETRIQSCPVGQSGAITQLRSSTCPGPTWSDWSTTANTCAVPPNNTQSCTLDGLTIAHNASQTFYSAQSVAYGQSCSAQTRTCTNGIFSGSDTFKYANCVTQQPAQCAWNGSSIAHGASVSANLTSTVPYGQLCQTQTRTCTNGTLSGTYTYASCAVGAPQACLLDGVTVNHAASQTFYSASTVAYGQNCSAISQARTCTNGTLSGNATYQYSTCAAQQPPSCTYNGQTIQHGGNVVAYQSLSVPYGNQCVPETRICNNGTLSGSYTNNSCTVQQPTSCTLDGVTVANGASRTFYSDAAIAYGNLCSAYAQSRICTNGTLSGSDVYKYSTCAVGDPNACSFNGQTVNHGASITAYQSSTVSYGQLCSAVAQTRTCSNGTLSGTYQYGSCTVAAPASCTFNGQSVANGASVTAYQTATVPYGQLCSSVAQTRTCTNGVLSGSYANASCSVAAAQCTPLPAETRTSTPCPVGQVGAITETRTSSCAAGATTPTWSNWSVTSNTCAPTTLSMNYSKSGYTYSGITGMFDHRANQIWTPDSNGTPGVFSHQTVWSYEGEVAHDHEGRDQYNWNNLAMRDYEEFIRRNGWIVQSGSTLDGENQFLPIRTKSVLFYWNPNTPQQVVLDITDTFKGGPAPYALEDIPSAVYAFKVEAELWDTWTNRKIYDYTDYQIWYPPATRDTVFFGPKIAILQDEDSSVYWADGRATSTNDHIHRAHTMAVGIGYGSRIYDYLSGWVAGTKYTWQW